MWPLIAKQKMSQ